jgi:hypothetical protein
VNALAIKARPKINRARKSGPGLSQINAIFYGENELVPDFAPILIAATSTRLVKVVDIACTIK